MFILLILFLVLPLQAADLSSDRRLILGCKQAVLRADLAFIEAQLNEYSEEEIKKRETIRQTEADNMLSALAEVPESELRCEDIDFCFQYRPNIHRSKYGVPPLIFASESNITMVRELIKAGADVNQTAYTDLDKHTTALMRTFHTKFSNNVSILLEAGATMPYDLDLAAGALDLRMWQDPTILAHRKTMIDTINETRLLVTNLSPIIVAYAFGKLPKIDPKTGDGYYSDEEGDEEDGE